MTEINGSAPNLDALLNSLKSNPVERPESGLVQDLQQQRDPIEEAERLDGVELSVEAERKSRKRTKIRNYQFQETRQFPSYDQVTTIKEKVMQEDGLNIPLAVSITTERIRQDPSKAENAQAHLSGPSVRKLLED